MTTTLTIEPLAGQVAFSMSDDDTHLRVRVSVKSAVDMVNMLRSPRYQGFKVSIPALGGLSYDCRMGALCLTQVRDGVLLLVNLAPGVLADLIETARLEVAAS